MFIAPKRTSKTIVSQPTNPIFPDYETGTTGYVLLTLVHHICLKSKLYMFRNTQKIDNLLGQQT